MGPNLRSTDAIRDAGPYIFVGPTLRDLPGGDRLVTEAGMSPLPPARRGDVDALVRANPPGILVLVDGRFHQALAVGHAELRRALESGWQVWGLASMGAIRAYEMRILGMHGFGTVYRHFLAESDFQDDEVALLHEPDPPYRSMGEPLIHMRHYVRDLEAERLITHEGACLVVAALKSRWYGERTLSILQTLLASHSAARVALRERLNAFFRYRVKAQDLSTFLTCQPWRDPYTPPEPLAAPYGTVT